MTTVSLLGAIASLFQTGSSSPTITIEEAVAIAEKSAFSIAIQKTSLEKARLAVEIAQKGYNPNINANASFSSGDAAIYGIGNDGKPQLINPRESSSVIASLSFPLDINGSLRNKLRAARGNRAATEETLNATLRDVRLSVRTAYYAVLRAQASVTVQRQALDQAIAQRDRAKLQFQADQIAKVDLTRFETQVVQSQGDLSNAENSLQLARNSLNQALARPIETPLEVVNIPDLKDPNLTADTAVSIAVQARPEIRAQKRTISALGNTRLATEASDDPTLAVGSQFTRQLGEVGLNTQRSSMVGTITLSIPITATGIVRKQVQQARQDEQLAQIQLKQLELNVSAEVRSALTNLTSARTRYNSATQQVALAEEVYRISIVRRDAGEATYVEVIDAQTSLTQARNQLNAARFDYLTAYSQLQRAVGSDNFSLPADAATPNRATPNGANSK